MRVCARARVEGVCRPAVGLRVVHALEVEVLEVCGAVPRGGGAERGRFRQGSRELRAGQGQGRWLNADGSLTRTLARRATGLSAAGARTQLTCTMPPEYRIQRGFSPMGGAVLLTRVLE